MSNSELIKLANNLSDRINLVRPTERSFASPDWFDPVFGGKLHGNLFIEGERFRHFNELMEDKVEYTIGRNNGDNEYTNILRQLADALNRVHLEVNETSDAIIEYCRYITDVLSTMTLDDSLKQTIGHVLAKIATRSEIYHDIVAICIELGCDVCNGTIHQDILTSGNYVMKHLPNGEYHNVYYEVRDWIKEFKHVANIIDDEVD